MRYTLLMHYPDMSADDLGPEALAEGMAPSPTRASSSAAPS